MPLCTSCREAFFSKTQGVKRAGVTNSPGFSRYLRRTPSSAGKPLARWLGSHGELKTTKASTSTRVPLDEAFLVPRGLVSRLWETDGTSPFFTYTTLRYWLLEAYRSRVLFAPSTDTSACPGLAPWSKPSLCFGSQFGSASLF